jgi:hypothetical protein
VALGLELLLHLLVFQSELVDLSERGFFEVNFGCDLWLKLFHILRQIMDPLLQRLNQVLVMRLLLLFSF